jgi:hypothetical protein
VSLSTADRDSILSLIDEIPSSSDMHTWSETTRQRLVKNPLRVVFANPLSIDSHRDLSAIGFSLTAKNYQFLGNSVKDAILSYSSRRNTKSYNRESLSAIQVQGILNQEVIEGPMLPEIAISGRLIATRDINRSITGLVLRAGNIEVTLNLEWVKVEFGSLDLFYRVNSIKEGGKQSRVYVLRLVNGNWSVRNWARPIAMLEEENFDDWEKRVKGILRDRNRFAIDGDKSASSNTLGLSDARGTYYH